MALRVSTRLCVWVSLCVWLFATTLAIGTAVLLLYMYDGLLRSFFGEPLTRLAQTSCVILAGWTLITFGAAIRTAKANRRTIAAVFFLFSILGFAGEMLIMTTLARYRDRVFGLSLLNEATLRLVKSYDKSAVARSVLDTIHARFLCCGTDEWHREWRDVPPFPERLDPTSSEPWVPRSCCIDILQSNPRCGFASIRAPVTVGQVMKQREYGLQTVIPRRWFTLVHNEPCPEKIFLWLEEVPVYILMCGLAISVARLMLAVHAVFAHTDGKKRRAKYK